MGRKQAHCGTSVSDLEQFNYADEIRRNLPSLVIAMPRVEVGGSFDPKRTGNLFLEQADKAIYPRYKMHKTQFLKSSTFAEVIIPGNESSDQRPCYC